MNLAHLGPPIPATAIDAPAFVIRKYSIMDILSPLGEAICVFTGHARENRMEVVLTVACHPRTGKVLRAVALDTATLASQPIHAQWVPGNVADIAQSKTLEVFNPSAIQALSLGSTRPG